MSDKNKDDKNKILKFPDGTSETIDTTPFLTDEEIDGIIYSEQHDIEPIVFNSLTVKDKDNDIDANLSDVIDKIADSEIKRMHGNLQFLNTVESSLKEQIVYAIESGTANIDMLLDVMDAFGKSVDRSNKIIKDKDSNLLNILIDNRTQIQSENIEVNTDEPQSLLSNQSKKKLMKLLNAFMYKEDEIVEEETDKDIE